MTEAEWLASKDPAALELQLWRSSFEDQKALNLRKLGLCYAACARRVWPMLQDSRHWQLQCFEVYLDEAAGRMSFEDWIANNPNVAACPSDQDEDDPDTAYTANPGHVTASRKLAADGVWGMLREFDIGSPATSSYHCFEALSLMPECAPTSRIGASTSREMDLA